MNIVRPEQTGLHNFFPIQTLRLLRELSPGLPRRLDSRRTPRVYPRASKQLSRTKPSISSPATMITGSGQALSNRRLWDRTTSMDIPGSLNPTRWPFGVKISPLLSSFRPSTLAPGRPPSQEHSRVTCCCFSCGLESRLPHPGRFCSGVGDGQSEPLRVDSAERLACDQEGIPD